MKKKTAAEIAGTGALVTLLALPVFLTMPGKLKKKDRRTFEGRNYAHRGLHTKDKPELFMSI